MKIALPTSEDSEDALVASFRQIGLSVGAGFDVNSIDEPTKRGLAGAAENAAPNGQRPEIS